MKYEDIVEIFNKIYITNDNNEMKFLGKYYKALQEGKKDDAEYYNCRVKEYYFKNEALENFIERLEELAKQSGEDVNV